MFFSTFFISALLATASIAAPINSPQELIVFSPHIISPEAAATWRMGSEQVVRWNTTGLPSQKSSAASLILLGYMKNGSENLYIDHPLASGFPMSAGSVKVMLPKNITARSDYFVVLFGDSGNKSQKFKIH